MKRKNQTNMKEQNQKETQEVAVEANLSLNGEEEISKRAYAVWEQSRRGSRRADSAADRHAR